MIVQSFKSTCAYVLRNKIILVIVMLAWILTLMPFVFDGQYGCVNGKCGMIVGTNYRDGLWFLAVAKTAFTTFPFQMPIYAGETLQGYHYLPNLVAYMLTSLGIPLLFTYYKIIPFFYMIAMTILSVILARKIMDNVLFVALFLFMTFFGMHLSLFTSLYHTGTIQNTVLINTFQATRILESPHTALGLLMLFFTLIIIYDKDRLRPKELGILSLILFVCFGTKFYIATTILCILGFRELLLLIQFNRWKQCVVNILVFSSSTLLAFIIFYDLLNFSKAGSVFIFSPFATVHHLIETPTLFDLHDMVLARYYLYAHGWSPRLFAIELFSVFLFVLFYFGTRIIGFFQIFKQLVLKKSDRLSFTLSLVILFLITASVLFIQKGDWYNPIQFAVPAAFLMNIFAAKLLYELYIHNKIIGTILIAIIVFATLPANLVNLGYLQHPARMVIPHGEMDALDFLSAQPDGTIFHPIDNTDMAYVSAFTGKPTYINFINVLQNADIPFEDRLSQVEKLENTDISTIEVDYIYLPLDSESNLKFYHRIKDSVILKKLYHNQEVVVFKLKKS